MEREGDIQGIGNETAAKSAEALSIPVAVVTGASSGIGLACAQRLIKRGFVVYGLSRTQGGLNMPEARWLKADVTSEAMVTQAVDTVVRDCGRIDVLVNSAGYALAGAIEDTSVEEARRQLETNFLGTMSVTNAILPVMRTRQSGVIVNIGSIAGVIGVPFHGVYSATKFALEGYTEALRIEVAAHGIHVSIVEPGDCCTNQADGRVRVSRSATHEVYRDAFAKGLSVMERDEKAGIPPDQVAALVERIVRTRKPRLRYACGPHLQVAALRLKPWLPSRLFERFMRDYYG